MTNSQTPTSSLFTLDPMHSTVTFSVRHLMITNVRGTIEPTSGTVRYDAAHPEATEVQIELAAASIHTRQPQRDAHLRSPEFFDAEKNPTVTFRSNRVGVAGGQLREIAGTLTIRGIAREIVLTVDEISAPSVDVNGKPRLGASASASFLRSEFGMTYNKVLETGGVAVADEVKLRFDVSLVKTDA